MSEHSDRAPADDDWHPVCTHEAINPSNPITLPFIRDALVDAIEDDIEGLEAVLTESETDEATSRLYPALVERRRELLRWVRSQSDDVVELDICPPSALRERERILQAEDEPLEPTALSRMREAIYDEEDYLGMLLDALRDTNSYTLISSVRDWAAAAFRSAHTLKYTNRLEGISYFPRTEPLKLAPEEWPAFGRSFDVMPFIMLEAAAQALPMTGYASLRCAELLKSLIKGKPPSDVASYLERVAKLYIWGFDSETYALARSVLEAALEMYVSDARVHDAFGRRPGERHPVDLAERIDAAHALGILDEASCTAAHNVRQDGNMVLHEFPNSNLYYKTPIDAIQALSQILSVLLAHPRRD